MAQDPGPPTIPPGEIPVGTYGEAEADVNGDVTQWSDTSDLPPNTTDPSNPLTYDPDGDDWPTAAGDPTPTGGEQYGWQEQQQQVNLAKPIANWPSNWKIKFNPPIATSASGAVTQVFGRNRKGGWSMQNERIPSSRGNTMDPAKIGLRLHRKGYIVPDVTYSEDWAATAEGNDIDTSEQLQKNSLIVLGKKNLLYGFKFMYNPATVDFSVSVHNGVNIGYLYSGANSAMPTGVEPSGSNIALTFPIVRIDDMQYIHKKAVTRPANDDLHSSRTVVTTTYSVDATGPQAIYGKTGAFFVDQTDINGIGSRGTMYDLEFLFRAALGRSWHTVYRGATADVGLLFSVPMKLVLSATMVYRVRLSNVSFTHRSFTPDMVPIYTDVALSFERIPDVVRAAVE